MNYLRERDDNCFFLSKIQSNIFEKASKNNIPSAFFVKVFSCSKYAKMMDDLSYLHTNLNEEIVFQEVIKEVKMVRGNVYPDYVMSWIGYLLREWAYRYNTKTKYILKKAPLSYLYKVYYPYHSLDIFKAIQEIAKDRNIDLNEDLEAKMRLILETIN